MELTEQNLDRILKRYEDKLPYKRGGDVSERIDYTLGEYQKIADNAINEARGIIEDTKGQFKALEIVIEGLTSEGLNHGHKRVIANHLITMLRSMLDKLDNAKYEYTSGLVDRYNFWRSQTPERKLYEDRHNLKIQVQNQATIIDALKAKDLKLYEELYRDNNLPF